MFDSVILKKLVYCPKEPKGQHLCMVQGHQRPLNEITITGIPRMHPNKPSVFHKSLLCEEREPIILEKE